MQSILLTSQVHTPWADLSSDELREMACKFEVCTVSTLQAFSQSAWMRFDLPDWVLHDYQLEREPRLHQVLSSPMDGTQSSVPPLSATVSYYYTRDAPSQYRVVLFAGRVFDWRILTGAAWMFPASVCGWRRDCAHTASVALLPTPGSPWRSTLFECQRYENVSLPCAKTAYKLVKGCVGFSTLASNAECIVGSKRCLRVLSYG